MESQTQNRIDGAFNKGDKILSIYFTAGFPELNDTTIILKKLQETGASMVEIGIPYSDPVADGPVIQQSNSIAIENGMTLKLLFEQLENLREDITIPVILMGYLNPIMQFGVEEFVVKCKEVGIDGVIIPDLPFQNYIEEYKEIFESNGIYNIFLISPQTSNERILQIDKDSKGFIYMVSSSSITGSAQKNQSTQEDYFKRVHSLPLKNKCLIGFGISDKTTFTNYTQLCDGGIIGSAFIKAISNSDDLPTTISNFVQSIKS